MHRAPRQLESSMYILVYVVHFGEEFINCISFIHAQSGASLIIGEISQTIGDSKMSVGVNVNVSGWLLSLCVL